MKKVMVFHNGVLLGNIKSIASATKATKVDRWTIYKLIKSGKETRTGYSFDLSIE